jgi:hypothetical protein
VHTTYLFELPGWRWTGCSGGWQWHTTNRLASLLKRRSGLLDLHAAAAVLSVQPKSVGCTRLYFLPQLSSQVSGWVEAHQCSVQPGYCMGRSRPSGACRWVCIGMWLRCLRQADAAAPFGSRWYTGGAKYLFQQGANHSAVTWHLQHPQVRRGSGGSGQ